MLVCPRCSASCEEVHRFCFACGGELARGAEAANHDPLVGRTLPGGYRVTHLVGVGGMGRVYCAEQVALGRTVAVKVVHPHLADDDLACARFLTEARTASLLSHPNSVAIFDFGRTEQKQPYIVMEYLRGRDLARVAHTEGPLALRRIVDILRQALAALEEAHALGIVHRDFKPDNVVLEPTRSGLDFVKVVDFGLAKRLSTAPAAAGSALTLPGLVCGTPEYMSPEQSRGDPLDGQADIYSAGVVLFELLTGRVPFTGESAAKTLLLHIHTPPPDPRNVAPDRSIPARFAEVTLRALAKAREERFQRAHDFALALEEALASVEGRTTPAAATAVRCRACGALSPATQKFCGDCGAAFPGAKPPAPNANPASARRALPLLAREDALEWLHTRRFRAESAFVAARIVGEAGAGKSRLLGEFLARCALRGDRIVTVAADAAWAKVGDVAVRDAVRGLLALPGSARSQRADPIENAGSARSQRADPIENAGSARSQRADPNGTEGAADGSEPWAECASGDAKLGLVALLSPEQEGPPLAPADRRRALAEALRWALARAVERTNDATVILAVDDLDFIDGTSRNAFADVLAEPPAARALVVVTYARAAAALPGDPEGASDWWTLAPLPPSSFAGFLPGRLSADPRPLLPLHVEQLIAWAREGRESPPERLADLVARRAERLAPEARHALHALAVWGDDASYDILSKLLPPEVDLGAALARLGRASLVVIEPPSVRIAHPLVRRVVFSSIPAGRKGEIFERAHAMRQGAPLELRAKLAMHGGSALEALSLFDLLSARRAAQGDLHGSVSALRHALDVARRELHRGDIDDPVGAMLLFARKLAEALAACGQWTDAEGVLREALGNAPPASEHRARLLGVLAHVAQSRSHLGEARRYIDEAMRVARQSDHRELLPMLERLERSIAVA
jgi:serine/threonine-protein kinase